MTTLKIAAIAGSMIIAAGGSAAVATRDKWWPETTTSDQEPEDNSSRDTVNLHGQDTGSSRSLDTNSAGDAAKKQCATTGDPVKTECEAS